ncbi:ELM1/GtrOC1 family putative glycosyltransferase [Acetobacter conturbans]|uniref:Nucleoside-diphosphate sugar epimerase n=1 Tax=Acetobacter conturbans TaxID=1737472 RepID=A0ABX0K036_9PROT|nr:ELM1/GtrOC1 family putative glycosyltransferase [Acetobacter conturbans]NHN88176.1 hypothetical protein [Acetobacter conturbans]
MPSEGARQTSVWVLETGQPGGIGPAHALAGRLGCTFLRLKDAQLREEDWPLPGLILTAGVKAGLAGLSLRRKMQVPVVHCGMRGAATLAFSRLFDETVLSAFHPYETTNVHVIPVLGPLSVVSPELYERAGRLWQERLEHLPQPRIAVRLESGWNAVNEEVVTAGRQLEMALRTFGGSILIAVGASVPNEMVESFVNALGSCFKLVWRHGEPDDDPSLGFIACADAVIVYGSRISTLVEVAASSLPVFLGHVPGRLGAYGRFARSLIEQDNIRVFDSDFSPWPRKPLDEAGRVAFIIKRRFALLESI